ncbi:MAG: hypothetical protein U0W24_10680 [Bacteroidales bacterium]
MKLQAQEDNNSGHYVFKEFTKGKVLMTSGITEEYQLNLNAITEKIIFQRGGQNLEIARPDLVDTVFIETRKFVPEKQVFYEFITNQPVEFFVEHKCNVIPKGKPAGYGTYTETGAATAIHTLTGRGQINSLRLPSEYNISPFKLLWVKKEGEMHGANSVNQLVKAFPDKKDAIKSWSKTHKTNFKKPEEVQLLLQNVL